MKFLYYILVAIATLFIVGYRPTVAASADVDLKDQSQVSLYSAIDSIGDLNDLCDPALREPARQIISLMDEATQVAKEVTKLSVQKMQMLSALNDLLKNAPPGGFIRPPPFDWTLFNSIQSQIDSKQARLAALDAALDAVKRAVGTTGLEKIFKCISQIKISNWSALKCVKFLFRFTVIGLVLGFIQDAACAWALAQSCGVTARDAFAEDVMTCQRQGGNACDFVAETLFNYLAEHGDELYDCVVRFGSPSHNYPDPRQSPNFHCSGLPEHTYACGQCQTIWGQMRMYYTFLDELGCSISDFLAQFQDDSMGGIPQLPPGALTNDDLIDGTGNAAASSVAHQHHFITAAIAVSVLVLTMWF